MNWFSFSVAEPGPPLFDIFTSGEHCSFKMVGMCGWTLIVDQKIQCVGVCVGVHACCIMYVFGMLVIARLRHTTFLLSDFRGIARCLR